MLKPKYLDNPGTKTKCTALTFLLNSWDISWRQKKNTAERSHGCYYFMLPNNNPTPPKHTNQILYLFNYSGVFPIRQHLSLNVEMSVCLWLLMRPTSLWNSIRSVVNLYLITTIDYFHRFLFNFYMVPTTWVPKNRKRILMRAKNNFWDSQCLSFYKVLQLVFIRHPLVV